MKEVVKFALVLTVGALLAHLAGYDELAAILLLPPYPLYEDFFQ